MASILFLFPTQAVASRRRVYPEACRALERDYGHKVVFCYNGPVLEGLEGLTVEHFDTWVDAHRAEIDAASLLDLEARFPGSNLWRSAVVERNLTDYSYLGGSTMFSTYGIDEIEWYLKALVLFYDGVLDRHGIDVAFNHVSDNIHAHVVYELATSKGILPLAVGRGLYWFDDMTYPQTEQSFGSAVLRRRYRELRDGTTHKEPNAWLEGEIDNFRAVEARAERPNIIYDKSVWRITRNAVKALRSELEFLSIRRPRIQDSNVRIGLWPAIRSYLLRSWNLAAMRRIANVRELPKEPFVFFPLHYQPEAALLGAAPGYLDQLALVRLLSASLPAGFRLVVKDHPVTGGAHGPAFYRDARALKNVVLLDERLSGRAITRAENCRLVATIGGTAGLEAMLFGKPVMMFGRAYYDCVDTLLRPPADLNDLPIVLKKTLIERAHAPAHEIEADGRTFFYAWLSIMRHAGKATYWAQDDHSAAASDWATLVHEMLQQVRHHG